jgi:hypothetical protein
MRLAGAACRGKRGPVEIEFLDSQKASAGSRFIVKDHDGKSLHTSISMTSRDSARRIAANRRAAACPFRYPCCIWPFLPATYAQQIVNPVDHILSFERHA